MCSVPRQDFTPAAAEPRPADPRRELFIYYRSKPQDAGALTAAVRVLHASLKASHPALRCRLLRRPDRSDGWQTWMETYSTDPMRDADGVTHEMQELIEAQAAALRPWIVGARHVEVFIACAS